jgi:quinol monooxygenase YgiN
MAEIKHAVQLKLRVKPELIDDFLGKVRRELFPTLNDQLGIRRTYLLRNPEGELSLLTFWNNKPEGDAYWASDSGRQAVDSITEMLEAEPFLTEYAVELHEVNAKDLPPPKSVARRINKSKGAAGRKKSVSSSAKRKISAGKRHRAR